MSELRDLAADLRNLLEMKGETPLTNAGLQKMIPFFVKGGAEPGGHKCGSCAMRIPTEGPKGDRGDCTHVAGGISLLRGTCSYWVQGEAATPADVNKEARMDHTGAGYVESDGPIQCATCFAFSKEGSCLLWKGAVKGDDCCPAWSQQGQGGQVIASELGEEKAEKKLKLREQSIGFLSRGLDFPVLASEPNDSPDYVQDDGADD